MLRKPRELDSDKCFQIQALDSLGSLEGGLRQQGGTGNDGLLLPLGDIQIGDLHLRILLEGKLYGVAQGQTERLTRGLLRPGGGSDQEE
mgnify:CR=1 FL=1